MRGALSAALTFHFRHCFCLVVAVRRYFPFVLMLFMAHVAWAAVSPDSTASKLKPWRPDIISADSAATLPERSLRDAEVRCSTVSEELIYTVRYGFISAGEARLVTGPGPTYDGRPTYRVVGTGRSTGAFDLVFKVRDHYESHVDQFGLFPHRFIRSVKEGGYRMEREVTFDPSRRLACTEENNSEKFQVLPAYCQDLVSAFHFARNLPLDTLPIGGTIEITTFLDGKVHPVRARKVGQEHIKVKAGEFDCWLFKPIVKAGRIWADEDDLTVYVSADARRIPVLVKSNLLVGSVRLELIAQNRTTTALVPQ